MLLTKKRGESVVNCQSLTKSYMRFGESLHFAQHMSASDRADYVRPDTEWRFAYSILLQDISATQRKTCLMLKRL
jgi:hypothetical protein